MSAAKWQELYEILKDMDEVEIRLTPQEDLYIVNLTMEEAKVVLEHTQDGAQTAFETSVSCIGAATCQVGLRDSNHVLEQLIQDLRSYQFKDHVLPRIYISGCPRFLWYKSRLGQSAYRALPKSSTKNRILPSK